jgi:hypothetical protein
MDPINVIPRPAKVISGEGEFVIKPSTSICASSEAWKVAEQLQRLLHLPLVSSEERSCPPGPSW